MFIVFGYFFLLLTLALRTFFTLLVAALIPKNKQFSMLSTTVPYFNAFSSTFICSCRFFIYLFILFSTFSTKRVNVINARCCCASYLLYTTINTKVACPSRKNADKQVNFGVDPCMRSGHRTVAAIAESTAAR